MSQENMVVVGPSSTPTTPATARRWIGCCTPTQTSPPSRRGAVPDHWRQGTTQRYFEQLDEAWTDLRIEIEDYRELGELVVALGLLRGAGMYSHIEVASHFAIVFVVQNLQILVVDSYDNWNAGLEAAGLRE